MLTAVSQSHTNTCHLVSSFNATAKQALKGLIWGSTSSEELKTKHNVKYNTSFDEPTIAVSKFFNLAAHWPSKV